MEYACEPELCTLLVCLGSSQRSGGVETGTLRTLLNTDAGAESWAFPRVSVYLPQVSCLENSVETGTQIARHRPCTLRVGQCARH